jgi:putative hemolysin
MVPQGRLMGFAAEMGQRVTVNHADNGVVTLVLPAGQVFHEKKTAHSARSWCKITCLGEYFFCFARNRYRKA